MSATLQTAPMPFMSAGSAPPARSHGLTLEERLSRSLAELRTAGTTECPLCHAPMRPAAEGGECSGCGSRLS